ncbi:carbohydrate kinase family protein [Candidatus Woesearchaeota archaeon]|nr:carbohydrate kinase family protein [Candidatus Woesearchaeota archaeon]
MLFKYDVLCVGSATLDRFLTIDVPLQSIRPGDKLLVKSTEIHSGGGATNSAAALSLLGLNVKMLTKLGSDHDAEYIIHEMKKYKVKNFGHRRSRHPTDSATIISSPRSSDRVIFVQKGASQDLIPADFSATHPHPRWIYLATLLGKSFQTAKMIASYAKARKIKLLFNPSFYLAQKGKSYLRQILHATTVLVLNKEEAQALLHAKTGNTSRLLHQLHALGPEIVVITDGARRCSALHQDKIYSYLPPRVKIVHTAGAGDAFTSGLLAGLIKKWSFEDCLRLGQANASAVIQRIGTKNGLLKEKQALAEIKKQKIKIVVSSSDRKSGH